MNQKAYSIITAIGFLAAGVAGMAIYANNQAASSGVVGASDTLSQIFNWAIAGLGGTAGIFGLIKQFFPRLSPVVDILSNSDIGDQILKNIHPILSAIDSDPANDEPIEFTLSRPLKNFDATIHILMKPKKPAS